MTNVIDRPPRASGVDAASYVDFTVGLRGFGLRELNNAMKQHVAEKTAERDFVEMKEFRQAIDPIAPVAFRNRVLRSQQEMTWARIRDSLYEREEALKKELDEAESKGPGSVTYDPNFQYPAYYTDHDIHLQPGSYEGDPLAGYIYHYGTDVFYAGRNHNNAAKQQAVNNVPIPEDGKIDNILDLACSIGQSTTAFKNRFPESRVVGADIAAPMVRYAHKRAVGLGSNVDFYQASADDLPFENDSFDLVYVNILFHEIPRDVAEKAVQEAHRVLRPGGLYVVSDFTNWEPNAPLGAGDYHRDIDSRYNGEPFASPFVYSDFAGLLRSVFAKVDPDSQPDPTGIRQIRVATK